MHAMRGMFIGLMIMGAVWTGGLVWSIFGGMVLVPSATLGSAGPKVAAPAVSAPAPVTQAKPAAPATQSKPAAAAAPAAATHGHADGHAVSHAASVPTATKGNQVLEPRVVDGVKVFEVTASVIKWEVAPGEIVDAY